MVCLVSPPRDRRTRCSLVLAEGGDGGRDSRCVRGRLGGSWSVSTRRGTQARATRPCGAWRPSRRALFSTATTTTDEQPGRDRTGTVAPALCAHALPLTLKSTTLRSFSRRWLRSAPCSRYATSCHISSSPPPRLSLMTTRPFDHTGPTHAS